jgi:mRNA-degrading endonuclease RelE of RelBE toxin-antitoxin system
MTYRVEFHAAALAQLKGLPTDVFDALVMRTDLGLMSFHVDEQNKLIRIFDVTWVG